MNKPSAAEVIARLEFRRKLLELLKEELMFEVEGGHFDDPNQRVVKAYLGKDMITSFSFSVADKEEYRDW